MPLVTVLLPARNAAATLPAALAGILRQTLRDLEIVAVDDGSMDATAEVLARAAERDPRVRVVRIAPPGAGIVAALQAGLARSSAPFVARMDADDVAHPQRLAAQTEALREDTRLGAVGARVALFPARSVRAGMRRYAEWLNGLHSAADHARERFVESPLVHPSVTLRREALDDAGGYRETQWPEDWDLWLRLHARGWRLAKVQRVLHFWRETPSRLTRTGARYTPSALRAARAHHLVAGPLARREAWVWGAGPIGRRLARELRARGARVAGFVDVDPKKVRNRRDTIDYRRLGGPDGRVVLAAVGVPGARDFIRDELLQRGWTEGRDFYCCA
jgi:glycosyltransferase involved in cell wall biosynthesis